MAQGNPNPPNQFEPGNKYGPPFGNKHAAKDRIYRKALVKQLNLAYEKFGVKEGEMLDAIAKQHIEDCLDADPHVRRPARDELSNRLDGKVPQALIGDPDEAPLITRLLING